MDKDKEQSIFTDLVIQLTREHSVMVHTDSGITYAKSLGLLEQLRAAVFGGMEAGGATKAPFRSKMPISDTALDLYTAIDDEITQLWVAAFGRVPGAEKVEGLLAQWAAFISPNTICEVTFKVNRTDSAGKAITGEDSLAPQRIRLKAKDFINRWIDQIHDLFNPPRYRELTVPCLHCGKTDSYAVQDGETVRQTALIIVLDRETEVATEIRCRACSTSWPRSMFYWFGEQSGLVKHSS